MKHNWNVRQTKKAIKAITRKLNDGDCASCAVGDFVRIVRRAPKDYVFVCDRYAAMSGLGGWGMVVGTERNDPNNGVTIIGTRGYEARYFGVDPYEASLIRPWWAK